MADGTLSTDYLVLIDNWPGAPAHNLSVPTDGFTGATTHNVAAAAYDLGTKIQVYNTGVTAGIAGFSTFIYLNIVVETTPVTAANQVVTPDTNASLYIVTNDPESCLAIPSLPSAVCLTATMNTGYYGWFWCGGVCPEEFATTLTGNILCVNTIALGSVVIASDLAVDSIGYAIATGAATDLIAAYTLSTDTN